MTSLTSLQGLLRAQHWVKLFACVSWFHLPGSLAAWSVFAHEELKSADTE